MKYKHKDKSQFNVRLSHFLYNGLEIISAQLGINRSEVMRISLYNLLKETYTKKEMDWFASRDDIVDEWIEYLKTPGRNQEFVKMKLSHEATVDEVDKYIGLFDSKVDKKLKKVKKKYAVPYAEDFLKTTNMNPKEAMEYFKNYNEKNRNEFLKYKKDLHNYFENEYPKEVKEIEVELEKLTGMTKEDVLATQITISLDDMQGYLQKIIEEKYANVKVVNWAENELKRIRELKAGKNKNDKKKEYGEIGELTEMSYYAPGKKKRGKKKNDKKRER